MQWFVFNTPTGQKQVQASSQAQAMSLMRTLLEGQGYGATDLSSLEFVASSPQQFSGIQTTQGPQQASVGSVSGTDRGAVPANIFRNYLRTTEGIDPDTSLFGNVAESKFGSVIDPAFGLATATGFQNPLGSEPGALGRFFGSIGGSGGANKYAAQVFDDLMTRMGRGSKLPDAINAFTKPQLSVDAAGSPTGGFTNEASLRDTYQTGVAAAAHKYNPWVAGRLLPSYGQVKAGYLDNPDEQDWLRRLQSRLGLG